jgi:hypothetical protein
MSLKLGWSCFRSAYDYESLSTLYELNFYFEGIWREVCDQTLNLALASNSRFPIMTNWRCLFRKISNL